VHRVLRAGGKGIENNATVSGVAEKLGQLRATSIAEGKKPWGSSIMDCMGGSSNQPDPQRLGVFDDLAAFRDCVFRKVGKRPHAHADTVVNGTQFDCAECIAWQSRFDAVFTEELDKRPLLRALIIPK